VEGRPVGPIRAAAAALVCSGKSLQVSDEQRDEIQRAFAFKLSAGRRPNANLDEAACAARREAWLSWRSGPTRRRSFHLRRSRLMLSIRRQVRDRFHPEDRRYSSR
jgi:hypothetical protein